MNQPLTEVVFILDRSGSMSGLEKDTIGGFNAMIARQKKEDGEALVSTILFNSTTEVLHDRVDVRTIAPLTDQDYEAGGLTALLDAVGGAICHIRNIHRYARKEDIPEKTLFVITTDGMENASHIYTAKAVKRMIEHERSNSGWEFLFLGANIDAIETAGSLGIGHDRAVNFKSDSAGTRLNYEVVDEAISMFRAKKEFSPHWKKRIDDDFETRKDQTQL